jgi:hypothetical protein
VYLREDQPHALEFINRQYIAHRTTNFLSAKDSGSTGKFPMLRRDSPRGGSVQAGEG